MKQHKITIIFDSEEAKDHVVGQLFDGWGENYIDLRRTGKETYHAKPIDEAWELDHADEEHDG